MLDSNQATFWQCYIDLTNNIHNVMPIIRNVEKY